MKRDISCCRLCKSKHIKNVINFGKIALANSYLTNPKSHEKKFSLTLVRCKTCGHIQLKETVDPKILFKKYFYRSSDSKYLLNYFKQYAAEIKNELKNDKNTKVLEIGCNCGLLLNELAKINFSEKFVGVDPATNIIPKNKNNITYYNDFFNKKIAEKIIKNHNKFSLIIANNVFAHISDIDSITAGVQKSLDHNGAFIFENAYGLSTIKGLFFDQIYHEHLQYFTIKPIQKYLNKFGLELFDVKFNENQGGSIRCFVKHIGSNSYKINKSVKTFIQSEEKFGLFKDSAFNKFKHDLNKIKKRVNKFINLTKIKNKTISCYGCPAKFALFCKFFGFNKNNIKYVVDDTPVKQGKFSPQSKIPIVNNKYFKNNPTDYCIISAWNVADFIRNSNQDYKGKFINIFSEDILQ
jgi:SAM-dependent methyltransferase